MYKAQVERMKKIFNGLIILSLCLFSPAILFAGVQDRVNQEVEKSKQQNPDNDVNQNDQLTQQQQMGDVHGGSGSESDGQMVAGGVNMGIGAVLLGVGWYMLAQPDISGTTKAIGTTLVIMGGMGLLQGATTMITAAATGDVSNSTGNIPNFNDNVDIPLDDNGLPNPDDPRFPKDKVPPDVIADINDARNKVAELKKEGYTFDLENQTMTDPDGNTHNFSDYKNASVDGLAAQGLPAATVASLKKKIKDKSKKLDKASVTAMAAAGGFGWLLSRSR